MQSDANINHMTEDFSSLLTAIQRVFPGTQLEPVSEQELQSLQQKHPGIPGHYLRFLNQVGFGSMGPGNFMIYNGLCEPEEIFDSETAKDSVGILFFGDDFSGCVVGFDTRNDWRIVAVDNGYREPCSTELRTLGEFIARRIANQETD